MGKYAVEHADVLTDIAEDGTAVTFTATNPGTYDPATDTWSNATTTSVAGKAIQVRGAPDRYLALELIESQAPTLIFCSTTYGQTPTMGSVCAWAGANYTLKDIIQVAPDGTTILSRLIVAR